jgi:endonuclease/exonuclease/phosphatase family metal-dependent hydrolase/FtsH-binding integral membrane protein
LIFFQLLADFIEAVYVFGLLGTGIPPEIVSVLFLLSPALLFFFRKRLPGWLFLVSGGVLIVARMVEAFLDTRGRMLASGLGVAAFMLFFPALLSNLRPRSRAAAKSMGVGLMLSLALLILFKTCNASVDLSTYAGYRWLGVALSLLAGILVLVFARGEAGPEEKERPEAGAFGAVFFSGLGIASIFLLLYFVFNSPNVLARWTGVDTHTVVILEWAGVLITAWIWFKDLKLVRSRNVLLIWNIVFGLALLLTILPHQVSFPVGNTGYPLAEAQAPWAGLLPLYAALLAFPILFLDMALFIETLLEQNPSTRTLAGSFTIFGLYLLLLVFAHVFTTVYDYIPVVGPLFRDKFWLVHLIPVAVLVFTFWLGERRRHTRESAETTPAGWFLGLAGIALVSIISACALSARPAPPGETEEGLRVLTFNIQQGYSAEGDWNYNGQLDLIRSQQPDVVGLQESDTNRIAGGNKDVVGYFADRLDMFSYYGPKPETGTFGIALLSRVPIQNARTYYLYSVGEQVAVIEAQIELDGKVMNLFINHLGNDGPLVQQEQFLELAAGKENVVAVGDCNFRPDSGQYALTIKTLDDAFLLGSALSNPEGFNPDDRIDYIFVSPGTQVLEARYILNSESDHPALLAVIAR